MNFFKKLVYLLVITFFLFSIPEKAYSQPDPTDDCVDANGDPIDPALCPIDGGLAILVATGAGLGLLRKKRQQQ